ncbi:beta-ketoacyl synthase N-terminal-like domain-containing protein [Streptomyces sp. NPDC005227]|uniref:beta-ketoacyl synthase N-terminal-like domain-containing protein n=1 Tax=Streptomyces sp. NPDC005227 TaxID=3364707 RepID=UPI0036920664
MNIIAWSAVSSYGRTAADFAQGVREDAAGDRPAPLSGSEHARVVPDFDARLLLGKKGTRYMNRVTALAVSAVGAAMADLDARHDPAETGLVLGTTTGSVQSMMEFTHASLTGNRPYDVEPSVIPNSVMNCAAARCAIWHDLRGPNTTLAAGRPAGILALAYARRLLRAGRARTVLCGGAEEWTPDRAWLHERSLGVPTAEGTEGGSRTATRVAGVRTGRLGEGASVVCVTTAPTVRPLATVRAVRSTAVPPPASAERVLSEVVRDVLADAGLDSSHVWGVARSGLDDDEANAVAALLPRQAAERLPAVGTFLGDTGAAAASLQIAAALPLAGPGAERDRHLLVTSTDPQGLAAAALLTVHPRPLESR